MNRLGATIANTPLSPVPEDLTLEVALDRPSLVDVGFGGKRSTPPRVCFGSLAIRLCGGIGDDSSNPYGAAPGSGLTMPPYFRPTPFITNNYSYVPGAEQLGPDEMQISFVGSAPWPPRIISELTATGRRWRD